MTIFDRVFLLAKEQGKTQNDIAMSCDVRQATVSDWKRGRSSPAAERIGDIAKFLNTTTDYLIYGKESATSLSSVVNQGVFGDKNQNNIVNIHGNGTIEISEFEGELVKVCGRLDMRRKNALLSYAYELEKQIIDNK